MLQVVLLQPVLVWSIGLVSEDADDFKFLFFNLAQKKCLSDHQNCCLISKFSSFIILDVIILPCPSYFTCDSYLWLTSLINLGEYHWDLSLLFLCFCFVKEREGSICRNNNWTVHAWILHEARRRAIGDVNYGASVYSVKNDRRPRRVISFIYLIWFIVPTTFFCQWAN